MAPKPKLQPIWLPGAFCAALCGISLVAAIATQGPSGGTAWQPAFFCFLPMVFWFAGAQEHAARQRLAALETRLAELEAARAA